MVPGLEKFINRFVNSKAVFAVLFITCFLAYGLSLDMYFWKDDFALMIKAQNPEESVGFFGPGLKGDGAYRYITIPFAFLYPTFGLNPMPYFFVGIILYFLASLGVFFLAREIFDNRQKAFLTAMIFSSGYIGADSIFGLTNSYQTSWVILFLTLSLTFFIRSFRKEKFGLYLISVLLFFLSLETGYIRAHGFFLIIVSSVFLIVDKISFKRLGEFLLKIIPFFFIFRYFYLTSTPAQVGFSQFNDSIKSGNYDYFFNPVITFINVFIPSALIKSLLNISSKLVGRDINIAKYQLLLLGIFFLALLLLIGIPVIKKKMTSKFPENLQSLRTMFFSLSMVAGSFIGVFYIGAASTYLESTHRYLSTALIGLSFFWVSLLTLLSSFLKTKFKNLGIWTGVLIIVTLYLLLGNLYALENINLRTKPQKEFFSQLKKEIPIIQDKIFLYFDVSNKNNSNGKFGNIFGAGSVGGSPEITMHYPGVDRYNVVMAISDFQDLVKKFDKEKGSIEKIYWFYFEDNKLTNRTDEFRDILKNGKISPLNLKTIHHSVNLIKKDNELELQNTSFEINLPNLPSLSDGVLKFNLTIKPSEVPNEEISYLSDEDEKYLQYLLAKSTIKKNSKVEAFNYFQSNYPENLFDNKLETTWMANRGPWHNLTHGITDRIQFLEISLDRPINLGGVLFTNGHSLRTPTEYRFLIKENGSWKEIKKSKNEAKATGEIWFEEITPVLTDSLRIEILNSSSGDAPQLSELELVDAQFADIDFKKAASIETDPSILLKRNPGSLLVKDYFGQNGKISFVYLSDKDNDYKVIPVNFNVKGFDKTYSYEIPISAGGTHLIKGKFFNLNFPAQYEFSDFEFINPALSFYLNKL